MLVLTRLLTASCPPPPSRSSLDFIGSCPCHFPKMPQISVLVSSELAPLCGSCLSLHISALMSPLLVKGIAPPGPWPLLLGLVCSPQNLTLTDPFCLWLLCLMLFLVPIYDLYLEQHTACVDSQTSCLQYIFWESLVLLDFMGGGGDSRKSPGVLLCMSSTSSQLIRTSVSRMSVHIQSDSELFSTMLQTAVCSAPTNLIFSVLKLL